MQRKVLNLIGVMMIILMTFALTACQKAPDQQAQSPAKPAKPEVILATTTSTQDSGLLDVIIPAFEKKTGYVIKTISVGTGQALAMGQKGEADVLLVHAPDAEKKVVDSGAAINRRLVMHNDFIIVGPGEDPAAIKGKSVIDTLKAISTGKAPFVSRGDDSGTHKLELNLWKAAAIKPQGNAWYQEAGAGMGQTLKIADEKKGYTIADRATYLSQAKNITAQILVEGDAKLLNIYHVMEVNPEKFDKVNKEGAKAFADFLLSNEGQSIISTFGKDKYGQALFTADGGKTEKDFGI
ncbi:MULTISPECIES: substrate-binding domain-containing protein [Sporomusa]|jgi:tungstate transport system substrate-binding protein|uniref:PBP superfamily domain protein n=1 Tax=Sporomusa sphaeroides DSM 2875 TaxID=1337886 RepID=A0ABP2CDV0_9FIRM|nr:MULTISPECIES: substrate-binding domain-containing protein [Sporomusa]MCM0758254.1 substrate-binding domain-containing protein [Sporomusa sphaeroides DSM 2875]OLS57880.1 PBP superfamily domain protein [Sporomusa sphaeroides DSM 2875]CVK20393.1 PBP superfamily domain protein [Sporomusa sphaeroides DSM 2875]